MKNFYMTIILFKYVSIFNYIGIILVQKLGKNSIFTIMLIEFWD